MKTNKKPYEIDTSESEFDKFKKYEEDDEHLPIISRFKERPNRSKKRLPRLIKYGPNPYLFDVKWYKEGEQRGSSYKIERSDSIFPEDTYVEKISNTDKDLLKQGRSRSLDPYEYKIVIPIRRNTIADVNDIIYNNDYGLKSKMKSKKNKKNKKSKMKNKKSKTKNKKSKKSKMKKTYKL
jgi:hypothetical protein